MPYMTLMEGSNNNSIGQGVFKYRRLVHERYFPHDELDFPPLVRELQATWSTIPMKRFENIFSMTQWYNRHFNGFSTLYLKHLAGSKHSLWTVTQSLWH